MKEDIEKWNKSRKNSNHWETLIIPWFKKPDNLWMCRHHPQSWSIDIIHHHYNSFELLSHPILVLFHSSSLVWFSSFFFSIIHFSSFLLFFPIFFSILFHLLAGQCETTISGHSDSIECVKWGGAGLLYSCSRDRTIKGDKNYMKKCSVFFVFSLSLSPTPFLSFSLSLFISLLLSLLVSLYLSLSISLSLSLSPSFSISVSLTHTPL